MRIESKQSFIEKYWLTVLIAAQPLLDVAAYWTRNSVGTVSGLLRLAVMLILAFFYAVVRKNRKVFWAVGIAGLLAALHVLNTLRTGSVSVLQDGANMLRILQLPVLAICLCAAIRDREDFRRAEQGLMLAALLYGLCLLVSVLTKTYNDTYGTGLGISGWTIDSNRCANSIIAVQLAVFSVLFALKTKKRGFCVLAAAAAFLVLTANATTACAWSVYFIFGGFAAFILFRDLLNKTRADAGKALFFALIAFCTFAFRDRLPSAVSDAYNDGTDYESIWAMNPELRPERELSEVDAKEAAGNAELLQELLNAYPELFPQEMLQRFGAEKMIVKYQQRPAVYYGVSYRQLKLACASLVWDECDGLTKTVGYDYMQMKLGNRWFDPESDWQAVFYYCGFLGFAFYLLFLAYFLFRIGRKLYRDFRGSLDVENCALLLCLCLDFGLANFSGAILRRPNVSVYMAVVLAMIYYKTKTEREEGAGA